MRKPPKPPGYYYWFWMNDPYMSRKPSKPQRNYLRTRTSKEVVFADLPAWTQNFPLVQWYANKNLSFKAKVLRKSTPTRPWRGNRGSLQRTYHILNDEAKEQFQWEHKGPPGNLRNKRLYSRKNRYKW